MTSSSNSHNIPIGIFWEGRYKLGASFSTENLYDSLRPQAEMPVIFSLNEQEVMCVSFSRADCFGLGLESRSCSDDMSH